MKKIILSTLILFLSIQYFLTAQVNNKPVFLTVDLAKETGPMYPAWAWFGYDEPNYTYMKDGQKLLSELSALSPDPVYVRVHNILTTDEGEHGPKWGSTNAYTEDTNGNPIYNWTIVDKIFDTFIERGMKPIVELGFMPKALSTKPEPYRNNWPSLPDTGDKTTGWTYPPKDYNKWAELVFQMTKHCIARYGQKEVESWYWELWNEPDAWIYWKGTTEEYFKMYDYTMWAVRKACTKAIVGGPTTTDPRDKSGDLFLRKFFEHCMNGTNYATGKVGSPLGFITFHCKGTVKQIDGHIQMYINWQLQTVSKGFEIVASYPKFKKLPIILGESDPETCAACTGANFAYRNSTIYSSYQAALFARKYALADFFKVNFKGAVTWAFEFENMPIFKGFREMATNGVDKPVLNTYRMFGMMTGTRINVSGGKYDLNTVVYKGVRGEEADINAMACKDKNSVTVLVWNYHDDDLPVPASAIEIAIAGLPTTNVLVHEYRIDKEFSNSYEVWKKMGSPPKPTPEQITELEKAGQLKLFTSPEWIKAKTNKTVKRIELQRYGVSLLKFTW
jgi:xylan 1,4-beta-xylosidase